MKHIWLHCECHWNGLCLKKQSRLESNHRFGAISEELDSMEWTAINFLDSKKSRFTVIFLWDLEYWKLYKKNKGFRGLAEKTTVTSGALIFYILKLIYENLWSRLARKTRTNVLVKMAKILDSWSSPYFWTPLSGIL